MEALPSFKYHPAPLATGALEKSDETCACCDKKRGYVATSKIYALEDVEFICPWCIHDGSAAKKFDGGFSDSHPLLSAGIKPEIVTEVCERTPSFISWQQEEWLSHCDDACAFMGDASKEELFALSEADIENILQDYGLSFSDWQDMAKHYTAGGDPAVYVFKCLHCDKTLYNMDCS